jgi:hypothetical protein
MRKLEYTHYKYTQKDNREGESSVRRPLSDLSLPLRIVDEILK